MSGRADEVRQDVAWLPPVRWATCVALWSAFAVVLLLPHLDLSLRTVAPIGFASAAFRTLVAVLDRRGGRGIGAALGLSWCADAALLTAFLEITGGAFNPFIVMLVTYVWIAAVTSPGWAVPVAFVAANGFSWLVLGHVH